MAFGEPHGDEAAHRVPGDGDPFDAEGIQRPGHVVGEVGEGERTGEVAAAPATAQVGGDDACLREPGCGPLPREVVGRDAVDREQRHPTGVRVPDAAGQRAAVDRSAERRVAGHRALQPPSMV